MSEFARLVFNLARIVAGSWLIGLMILTDTDPASPLAVALATFVATGLVVSLMWRLEARP